MLPRCWSIVAVVLPLRLAAASAPEPLPAVPAGFSISIFAREPLVRNPCALAFDSRGRLFVGQGPQYRNPTPDTPGDTVELLLDTDGDGVADRINTFARGLNCVQGLAWRGRDLWIANSPDLTICRDLDGDDEADEYVLVYTDLGNIEHALHGLSWAPDGKLYMSKGNSKGLNVPGRVAPRAFRELFDLPAPAGAADFPPPRTFTKDTYRNSYQDPADDWGRMGGVLRCDDLGANLEIVARGLRNPWDIGYDSGFNWLGTDNDQSEGDRIVMPFFGAHFGWAHDWASHWTGEGQWASVPISGPTFPGSGTGVLYLDAPEFPAAWRGVWLINDFLRRTVFAYRPTWDGALLWPAGGDWQPFVRGGDAIFNPVDIEIGPDGALYVTGWGTQLGATFRDGKFVSEGRIFRIAPTNIARPAEAPHRSEPATKWSFTQLAADLDSAIPARRTDAAEELVRRGPSAIAPLQALARQGGLSMRQETWTLWTLGRLTSEDASLDAWFGTTGTPLSPNARLQALRIVAHRIREWRPNAPLPSFVATALVDAEPRVRFTALQSIAQARRPDLAAAICDVAAQETDRLVFYAAWHALAETAAPAALRPLLRDPRAGVRRAALLALLAKKSLAEPEARGLLTDSDAAVAGIAGQWLARQGGNPLIVFEPAPGDFADRTRVVIIAGLQPGTLRYTRDGTEPTYAPGNVREVVELTDTTTLKAAIFVEGRKVGNTATATFRRRAPLTPTAAITLPAPARAVTVEQVLPLLPGADRARGQAVFGAAGCAVCHRVVADGGVFGPDLSGLGERGNVERIIRAILAPSAEITEGYALRTYGLKDGREVSGRLVEENARDLVLMQPDGNRVSVVRNEVARHESHALSAMPPFDHVLTPGDLAALVSWLVAPAGPPNTTGTAAAPARGFALTQGDDRLTITHDGKPVADYVTRDPRILRPYFSNLHAPGGARITRHHPIREGDAPDHPTMHPGAWFGFGSVNGEDFWRNKGRIEHTRFSAAPTVRDGAVTFATENRLVARDGTALATLELRVTLRHAADGFLLGCDLALHSETRDLVFGDQEEMGFGVRLATPLIETHGSTMTTALGASGAKSAWGTVADWCLAAREQDGRVRGAALLAAPTNPQRTWWHARDYGLMVANSFGPRVLPAAQTNLTVPRGRTLSLRYGLYFFDRSAPPDVAALHREFFSLP